MSEVTVESEMFPEVAESEVIEEVQERGQEVTHSEALALSVDEFAALEERVPAGASFGFNHLDGRTWIHIWRPDVDRGATRAVLDAALTALGRR